MSTCFFYIYVMLSCLIYQCNNFWWTNNLQCSISTSCRLALSVVLLLHTDKKNQFQRMWGREARAYICWSVGGLQQLVHVHHAYFTSMHDHVSIQHRYDLIINVTHWADQIWKTAFESIGAPNIWRRFLHTAGIAVPYMRYQKGNPNWVPSSLSTKKHVGHIWAIYTVYFSERANY
jgi:hypothetical protein